MARCHPGLRVLDDARVHTQMVRLGAAEAIIAAMRLLCANEAVNIHGCYALGMLAQSEENKIHIAQVHGIQQVLAALSVHSSHEHVNGHGCAALCMLCEINQNKVAVRDCNGLEVIVAAARNFGQHPQVMAQILRLFALLSLDPGSRQALSKLNVLKVIVSAVRHSSGQSHDVLLYGFKVIANMVTTYKLETDMIDIIYAAMNAFPEDPKVQEDGRMICKAMNAFSQGPDPFEKQVNPRKPHHSKEPSARHEYTGPRKPMFAKKNRASSSSSSSRSRGKLRCRKCENPNSHKSHICGKDGRSRDGGLNKITSL